MSSNLILGGFLGALLAIVIAVLPVSAYLLAPALILAAAAVLVSKPVDYGRLVAFGGMLIGAGAMFLYGVVNTVAACLGTSDFCGRANILPLTALAVAMLGAGWLIAGAAARRARRAPS